jgi:hypothetical protein
MSEMRSYVESTKSGLFERLCTSLETRFGDDKENAKPFDQWVTKVSLDGKPLTFHKHEYLREPYEDAHPHVVEMKAAQMGLTTKAMLSALYLCRFGGIRGVLYLFPSRTDVLDFSRSRVAPLIEENCDTIGCWIRDTDSAGLKQEDAFLYLRGCNRVGLKVPVDYTVMDELTRPSKCR